jgi:homogentisate 1,2-dioxygenase
LLAAVPPFHAARAARLPRATSHARGFFTTIFLYYVHNALKEINMPKKGLYANIHAKRKRIAAGSGEKMRKAGSKGAPSAKAFKAAAKTAKKPKKKAKK